MVWSFYAIMIHDDVSFDYLYGLEMEGSVLLIS